MRARVRTACAVVAAGVAATAMTLVPVHGGAQTVSGPMAFDTASIRRNVNNVGTCDPGQVQPAANGFHMTNCPLFVAVGAAYVPAAGNPLGFLVEDRIAGMPGWLTQERYNLDARISDADAAAWRDPVRQKEMLRAMMQTLLAERCRLAVHREMRDKPVFALVIGTNGPKLVPSEAEAVDAARAKHPDAVGVPGGSGFFLRGPNGHIDLYGATTGTLALLLSGATGRPVVDRTGLTRLYDMHLDMGQPGVTVDASADAGATVFAAVEEQLGLKLESRKLPVEYLVIDHVERPSSN